MASTGSLGVDVGENGGTHTLLGLPRDAPLWQVRAAYRRLAMERHPDRGGDPEAFRDLVVAYRQLVAEHRRPVAPVAAAHPMSTRTPAAVVHDDVPECTPAHVLASYVALVVSIVLGVRALVGFDVDGIVTSLQIALVAGVVTHVVVCLRRR